MPDLKTLGGVPISIGWLYAASKEFITDPWAIITPGGTQLTTREPFNSDAEYSTAKANLLSSIFGGGRLAYGDAAKFRRNNPKGLWSTWVSTNYGKPDRSGDLSNLVDGINGVDPIGYEGNSADPDNYFYAPANPCLLTYIICSLSSRRLVNEPLWIDTLTAKMDFNIYPSNRQINDSEYAHECFAHCNALRAVLGSGAFIGANLAHSYASDTASLASNLVRLGILDGLLMEHCDWRADGLFDKYNKTLDVMGKLHKTVVIRTRDDEAAKNATKIDYYQIYASLALGCDKSMFAVYWQDPIVNEGRQIWMSGSLPNLGNPIAPFPAEFEPGKFKRVFTLGEIIIDRNKKDYSITFKKAPVMTTGLL